MSVSRMTADLHPPVPGGAAAIAYNAALTAMSPALLSWFGYRVLWSGKSRDGWLERLGWPSVNQAAITPRQNIWIHAVSVGEVTVASSILKAYSALIEAFESEISTITSTGRAMAEKILPDTKVFYLPVDILPAVRAVVRRVQPLCLTLCEKEIWPNLISECKRSGAGVALMNGQVTESRMAKARNFGWIYKWALGNIDRFLMQFDADADRIISLGAPSERVEVVGNVKFDQASDPLSPDEINALADSFGIEAFMPIFVAGSTNAGEEGIVIRAFKEARTVVPDLRLILAPRQIERAQEVAEIASTFGYTSINRSEVSGPHSKDIIILDTFGELADAYALATVAFVGGTFIDKGGHNILQPLAQGVPVTFGPYDYKIRDITLQAVNAGVGARAETPESLSSIVSELAKGTQHSDYRERALKLIMDNRGASRRCAEVIRDLSVAAARQ